MSAATALGAYAKIQDVLDASGVTEKVYRKRLARQYRAIKRMGGETYVDLEKLKEHDGPVWRKVLHRAIEQELLASEPSVTK